MALDPDGVDVVTFDSYGTVVDVDDVERALEARVADPRSVSRLWRFRSLLYAMTGNVVGVYVPFYDVLRRSLSYALAVHDEDLTESEREAILGTYHDLAAFDDVRPGMDRLYDEGYDCYVVSNGDPEMLASMVEGAGVSGLVEDTVSADEVRRYKPDPELYRHAAARAGTDVDRICHVSALWFDVQGAANAGMRTAWVNRRGGPPDTFGTDPDLVAADFGEVAEALLE
jgi:2-haloacid dehalogenase